MRADADARTCAGVLFLILGADNYISICISISICTGICTSICTSFGTDACPCTGRNPN